VATITLGYGPASINWEYDPSRFELIEPESSASTVVGGFDIGVALSNPIDSQPLEEFVDANDRICIVVPDATRRAGVDRIAAALLLRLGELGVPDGNVSFLIGGGIHRPPTDVECELILGAAVNKRARVVVHDAAALADLVELGITARGTPVTLNRHVQEADHTILVGAIGFHYFAGFTGGRKALLPGCASAEAIRANHLLALDDERLGRRTGVGTGRLDGNAVHEDMEEAARMVEPSFLVNTVVDAAGHIQAVYAGHWRNAHRRGCAEYADRHAMAVARRRELVVVSCGGAPRDVNLIQAHKAIEHASGAILDGGLMIVLAECREGLGRDDFLAWFVPGGARATASLLQERYQVNGQTAWALRSKVERFRILLVSKLDPETVRRMGMEPYATLDSALSAAPPVDGYVIPQGAATLPYVRDIGEDSRKSRG
jgi:nickel-dependent lactate racemase